MTMRRLLCSAALWLAAPAVAGDLSVTVRDSAGAPVRNAVVWVDAASGGAARFAGPFAMAQQGIQFDPYVLVVPVGAEVTFPNRDKVRHHVYSFSPTKRFELKLYGKEEARSVKFDKPGTVALGCNIHDQMSGFIKVVDTPFAAKTGSDGVVTLRGLPTGGAVMHVWHPQLRAPGGEMERRVALPAGASAQAVSVALRSTEDASRH